MTFTVPSMGGKKDEELYLIQQKISNFQALIGANSSPLLRQSYVDGLAAAQNELVLGALAHGKLQASTILSTCTYGT